MTTNPLRFGLALILHWHRRSTAIKALSNLDDRLLRDAGIERHEIEHTVNHWFQTEPQGPLRSRTGRRGNSYGVASAYPRIEFGSTASPYRQWFIQIGGVSPARS